MYFFLTLFMDDFWNTVLLGYKLICTFRFTLACVGPFNLVDQDVLGWVVDGLDDWGCVVRVNDWGRVDDWNAVVRVTVREGWWYSNNTLTSWWVELRGKSGQLEMRAKLERSGRLGHCYSRKNFYERKILTSNEYAYVFTTGAEWWTTWLEEYEVATGAAWTTLMAGWAMYPALATAKMHEATNCNWFDH